MGLQCPSDMDGVPLSDAVKLFLYPFLCFSQAYCLYILLNELAGGTPLHVHIEIGCFELNVYYFGVTLTVTFCGNSKHDFSFAEL